MNLKILRSAKPGIDDLTATLADVVIASPQECQRAILVLLDQMGDEVRERLLAERGVVLMLQRAQGSIQ